MANRSTEEKRTDSPESQSDSGANLPQREERERKPQEGEFRDAETSANSKEAFGNDYESEQKNEQQQEELEDKETGRTKKS